MSGPEHGLAASPAALAPFDRDWTLAALLPEDEWPRLSGQLAQLLGVPVALVAGADPPAGEAAQALTVEIEPVGWLVAAGARPPARAAAAALVGQLLQARQRYAMASALYVESVQADYLALLEKHEALEQSEQRYRMLARQLEARVAEQVALIETRQRQLYQAERLASVAGLAAGMAHELNNPLGFVRSNLGSAQRYCHLLATALCEAEAGDPQAWQKIGAGELLDDFAALLRDCVDGVDRMAAIVHDLKGMAGAGHDHPAPVDLAGCLDELCRVFVPRLPEAARLVCEGQMSRDLVCRAAPLQQALFRILDNALKAIGPGGHIAIRCRIEAGRQWLRIADDGCGIAPDNLSRVFDPFFTTRAVGAGIGLGLTLARDLILGQQGQIELASTPGQGTVVTVSLPLAGPA